MGKQAPPTSTAPLTRRGALRRTGKHVLSLDSGRPMHQLLLGLLLVLGSEALSPVTGQIGGACHAAIRGGCVIGARCDRTRNTCIQICPEELTESTGENRMVRVNRYGQLDEEGAWCIEGTKGMVLGHFHRVKAYTGFSASSIFFMIIVMVLGVLLVLSVCKPDVYDVRQTWRARRPAVNRQEITNFCGEEEHLFLIQAN